MQIIKGIEQGTPEWKSLRAGIFTMSNAGLLDVAGKGEGGLGAGAITYMHELIAERFTGETEGFAGNAHTERGHADELIAKELYMGGEGHECYEATIILNHGVGYSPDWVVGDNGLLEVKSKLPKIQVGVLLGKEVPKEHIPQCQGGLWVSGREWIDFISYSAGMPMFEKRVYRDEQYIKNLSDKVKVFYEVMERKIEEILK
jgi:hypothetical protein